MTYDNWFNTKITLISVIHEKKCSEYYNFNHKLKIYKWKLKAQYKVRKKQR